MSEYKPGNCNIGKNEIRKRYALAVAVFVIVVIAFYGIVSLNLPHWSLLLLFIPLIMGFEGFYQGYFHFCAGFAAKGIYDLSGSGGSRNNVTDPESHKKDMKKANQIHMYSVVSSLIIVIVIYFAL